MDERKLHLSHDERETLKKISFFYSFSNLLTHNDRCNLTSLLERSAPKRPGVRFIVRCKSSYAGRVWEKEFFDRGAAQAYARHAVGTWCRREDVRIVKQKWISY